MIFWLLKESCLEGLIKKDIISNQFHIGVKSIADKNLIITQFPQHTNFLDITVEPNRSIKSIELYNLLINVPCPVIRYLEEFTKKSWKEIKNEKL